MLQKYILKLLLLPKCCLSFTKINKSLFVYEIMNNIPCSRWGFPFPSFHISHTHHVRFRIEKKMWNERKIVEFFYEYLKMFFLKKYESKDICLTALCCFYCCCCSFHSIHFNIQFFFLTIIWCIKCRMNMSLIELLKFE